MKQLAQFIHHPRDVRVRSEPEQNGSRPVTRTTVDALVVRGHGTIT